MNRRNAGLALALAACTEPAIWVEGDLPPEPPEGFRVETFEGIEADGTLAVEIDPQTTAVQVFARIVEPRRDDTMGLTVTSGPLDLVDVFQTGGFSPELDFRWPQHPDQAGASMSGTWELSLEGPPGRTVEVTVSQWADDDPLSGTVHVQLVYPEGMDTEANRQAVATALDRWSGVWGPYGLAVAPYVQTSNAPARCPNALPPRGGDAIYEALSAAGAVHDVTLVVCDSLAGNGDAIGVSFGGPLASSPRAATVVRMSEYADRMGQTMAHEVAHYAGLAHADEDDGLDDTFECPSSMSSTACSEQVGRNNLYSGTLCGFGTAGIEGATEVDGCVLQDQLTPDQVWMLQSWIGTTE